jgi:hypothetical protein
VVPILVSAAPQRPSNVTRASRKPLYNLAENPYPEPLCFLCFLLFNFLLLHLRVPPKPVEHQTGQSGNHCITLLKIRIPDPFVSFASFCSIFSYLIFVFHPSPSNIKQGNPEPCITLLKIGILNPFVSFASFCLIFLFLFVRFFCDIPKWNRTRIEKV